MAKANTQKEPETTKEVAEVKAPSLSQRFVEKVMTEIGDVTGDNLMVNDAQKKLAKNYFIKLDMVLRDAEIKRSSKSNADPLPVTWVNVNTQKLSMDVVAFTSVGLDPMQDNHIHLIPFKNNKTGKYDITCMIGYKGIELKAKKFGHDAPDDIICELVYSNDKFKQVKRDINNRVEGYYFEIVNDFDRGEVVGGFYYHVYLNNQEKNKLVVFSKKDIEKRKPKYASAEFWGGEKDKWENGKKVGKEKIDGWYDEMALKTIKRAAWNDINIDSTKIDEKLLASINGAASGDVESKVAEEINSNANKEDLSFDDAEEVIDDVPEIPEAKVESDGQTSIV